VKRSERSAFEFLALNRNITLLLFAIILISSGEEMWMRFVPKYLEALGATAFLIGLFDAVKTLLGALYAYPGGVVVDRWGHRRAFVAFTGLSLAGYSAMLLTHRPAGVIVAMFLFLAWSNLSLPATFSLVAASLPAGKHTMGIGVQSLIKRLPIVIGPVAGGMLMDRLGLVSGVRAGIFHFDSAHPLFDLPAAGDSRHGLHGAAGAKQCCTGVAILSAGAPSPAMERHSDSLL
jgi:predicted MFS family arabinose efflux permease